MLLINKPHHVSDTVVMRRIRSCNLSNSKLTAVVSESRRHVNFTGRVRCSCNKRWSAPTGLMPTHFILLAKTYFTVGDISKKFSATMNTVFVHGIFYFTPKTKTGRSDVG